MKIVLDTNVFISGVFWRGSPYKVLNLWVGDKVQILITEKILAEYLRLLNKIDRKMELSFKWGSFIIENSLILEDLNLVNICRDAEDNKFLNCAISGRADYLVSGDNDLLTLGGIGSCKIVTPAQFLKIY